MNKNTGKYIYTIALLLVFAVSTASAQQKESSQTEKQKYSQNQSASDTQSCATFAPFGFQLVICWGHQNNKNSYSIKMNAKTKRSNTSR